MTKREREIVIWLCFVCLLIFLTIVVGGLTRLTISGLSITSWDPVMGVTPPLTQRAWVEAFEAYKQVPQYELLNKGMSLGDFKTIFYWEYFHRLTARLIGLAFFLPLVIFQIKGYFSKALAVKMWLGLLLGGSQGFLGWYMVKSGLADNPFVSHYRLASHLLLAFIILAYLLWQILNLIRGPRNTSITHKMYGAAQFVLCIIVLQITYGAFTAGLKAGSIYNTFPLMHGEFFPRAIIELVPVWRNLFEGGIAVQFIHRMLAWLLVLLIPVLWFKIIRGLSSPWQKKSATALLLILGVQFALGILTLVNHVPTYLASLHQVGAFFLFNCSVVLCHSLRQER